MKSTYCFVSGDSDLYRDPDRPAASQAVVIEPIFKAIASVGDRPESGAHHFLAVGLEQTHVPKHDSGAVTLRYETKPIFAALQRHQLRQQISLPLDRCPYIRQDQIPRVPFELAGAHEPNRWNPDALLIDFLRQRHRPGTHAANIGVMRTIR